MSNEGIQRLIMEQDALRSNQHDTFSPDVRLNTSDNLSENNTSLMNILENEKKHGYQLGYEEGIKKAQQEWQTKIAHLSKIIDASQQSLTDTDNTIQQKVLEISLAIAKQIICRELTIDSGQVVSTVKKALELIPNTEHEITVHINPTDEPLINEVFSQYLNSERFKVFKDPTIVAGGCKVSTDYSSVDLTIDSQVASIAANILGDQRLNNN